MSWTMRWVALAGILASGCAEGAREGEPLEPVRDEAGGPVVATLRTKDSELTITGSTSGGGVRYSLRDAAGQQRANLTLEELLAYDQDLYEVVKFAIAKGDARRPPASFVDARVDRAPLDSRVNALQANPALRSTPALRSNPAPSAASSPNPALLGDR